MEAAVAATETMEGDFYLCTFYFESESAFAHQLSTDNCIMHTHTVSATANIHHRKHSYSSRRIFKFLVYFFFITYVRSLVR